MALVGPVRGEFLRAELRISSVQRESAKDASCNSIRRAIKADRVRTGTLLGQLNPSNSVSLGSTVRRLLSYRFVTQEDAITTIYRNHNALPSELESCDSFRIGLLEVGSWRAVPPIAW